MKKLFITTIALAAILSLGACGDKSEHKHKSRNRDNKESIFSTESNREKSESDEKESHKSKISDITSNCVSVDPFETFSVSIDTEKCAFPETVCIKKTYGEKNYWEYIDYTSDITSIDKNKIVVYVDAFICEDDLSDEMFDGKEIKIERENKEYTIPLDDIPICLLNSSMLTDDDLHELDNICREKVNEGLQFYDPSADDSDYEIVSTYVSFGNIEDYISQEISQKPLRIDDEAVALLGNGWNVERNNRVIFIYKSKSNFYYIGTVRPFFLDDEMIRTECSDVRNYWGNVEICNNLNMVYSTEEEAVSAVKDWLNDSIGYHEENFVKIANPTK